MVSPPPTPGGHGEDLRTSSLLEDQEHNRQSGRGRLAKLPAAGYTPLFRLAIKIRERLWSEVRGLIRLINL